MDALTSPTTIHAHAIARRHHRGGFVLALGLLGFLVAGVILGPIAWWMGSRDLDAMDREEMDPTGRELTQAGRICGIIVTFLNVIGAALGIGLLTILVLGLLLGA